MLTAEGSNPLYYCTIPWLYLEMTEVAISLPEQLLSQQEFGCFSLMPLFVAMRSEQA